MTGLDWTGLMRAGLHGLGLRPAEFWALTPAELMVMLGRDEAAAGGFTRARFDALMRRFPDVPRNGKEAVDGDDGRIECATGRAGNADGGDFGPGGGAGFRSCRHGPRPGGQQP
ncbi:MAG: phage tail assembly chaperone [Rhodobacter sp.]|nr:phage tail assembly chaperone [Paracoccaceae bacterium]MCC0073516.1 phage tail assembly chaperone [Rhodobacter sp.]